MKKLFVLGIVIIVAVLTNPKKQDHIDVIKKEISSRSLENSMDDLTTGNDMERAGSALGMTLGMALLDKMLESLIEVDNYLLFSLSKLSYNGNERIIAIGAFGNVWLLFDPEELQKGRP